MYLRINAFALSGRSNNNTIILRVSLRLPYAMYDNSALLKLNLKL